MVPVHCGEVIADRYRVERLLGIGGMGAVVAARHLSLGELVAIKFMRAEYCNNAALLRRFQREARGMFRLKTEHVPRVYDLGALPPRPGVGLPVPFIVMEHLSGNDLRSIVERRGRLPIDEAAEYVRQACVALTEAHALGMVHRDLKPANLFLTYRTDGTPLVKVLDFGVAKFTTAKPEDDGLEMTTARSVMGSRRYMAPEQMLTPKDVDLRADLWALGVVLYQLVSGSLPFGAETLEQLVLVVTEQAPRPLRSARADLPEGFEEIVMRCLEKNRARRPASARELSAALAPFALCGPPDATLPTAVHRSHPTFTWLDEGPPTTAVRPPESKRPEPRRPRRAWVAAAGAFSATAALAAAVLPSGWPGAAGPTWADGASAQRLTGVPQALAEVPQALAEVPQATAMAAGPLASREAAGGALHGGAGSAAGAPVGDAAGEAQAAACDAAGLVLPARAAQPGRAGSEPSPRAALAPGASQGGAAMAPRATQEPRERLERPARPGGRERPAPAAGAPQTATAARQEPAQRPAPQGAPSPAPIVSAAVAGAPAAPEVAAARAGVAPAPAEAPGRSAEAAPAGASDSPW
ncbi:protein kinase domain-containing protein [Sorangium sp. So ce513]|uniref:serine/threonine-protein kinase n=1 Tax=Sorangium sp. So ce513 TaxID=3133315 RepID=UPI003F63E3D8